METYADILQRFMTDSGTNATVSNMGVHTIPHNPILNEDAYRDTASSFVSYSDHNAKRIDYLESILGDILGILALMYDREGPRVGDMSGVRAFIDSIKVVEGDGHD